MSQLKEKKWITPEITIISRSAPEEAVLKACSGLHVHSANQTWGGCTIGAERCDICETQTHS